MPAHAAPRPGFFAVLALPRAYGTLAYLLLSMATGILAFTFAVVGLSLSLGLAVLIVGVPFTLGFLALTRVLAVGEARLLRALVAPGASPDAPLLPPGAGWPERLKGLVSDRRTWTSLAYFLLLLPLGVAYGTLMISLLALALTLVAVPVLALVQGPGVLALEGLKVAQDHRGLVAVACGLAGALLLPATLQAGLLLGRFQAWLARHLLVQG